VKQLQGCERSRAWLVHSGGNAIRCEAAEFGEEVCDSAEKQSAARFGKTSHAPSGSVLEPSVPREDYQSTSVYLSVEKLPIAASQQKAQTLTYE